MTASRITRWLLVALAIVAMLLVIFAWRDPYAIVRAEYARQRVAAGF